MRSGWVASTAFPPHVAIVGERNVGEDDVAPAGASLYMYGSLRHGKVFYSGGGKMDEGLAVLIKQISDGKGVHR